jgi:nitroreductase
MTFSEIVKKRRSMRKYDQTFAFDHEAVQRSLELAVLAPNSSNMQMWEFYRIISPALKTEVAKICMGQGAAKTASEIVVFVTRQDKYKERASWNLATKKSLNPAKGIEKDEKYYGKQMPVFYKYDAFGLSTLFRWAFSTYTGLKKPFMRQYSQGDLRTILHKTIALAAQTFMLAMVDEGYDTCPMEGFDEIRLKKLLKLPKMAEVSMVIACGKGLPEGIYTPRLRVPNEDVIFKL